MTLWSGREMAFLKGNLPTISRVHGFPYLATHLNRKVEGA